MWLWMLGESRIQRGRPASWEVRKELRVLSPKPENSLLLNRRQVFFSIRLSTGWMRPTHILESNPLYLVSTDFNTNLIQTRHRNIQNNV